MYNYMDDGLIYEKIIILRKEGKSFNKIKEELGCSKGYISDVCKKHNLSDIGLSKGKKLNDSEIKELKEYYKNHTKEETANKYGISECTVTKYKDIKRVPLSDVEKIENNYTRVKSFRKRTKERAVNYKGGKCILCGYDRCIKALDFHHLNPKEKDFSISKNCNKAWDKVKIELDKCILVCSNCHREVHDNMHNLDNLSFVRTNGGAPDL